MSGTTRIEWTEATWNPITGCSEISAGCRHCYARRWAERFRGRAEYPADEPFRVTFHPERLREPMRWRKRRSIFVCSMGDLFHPDVDERWLDAIWGVMALCQDHRFEVLTKRPYAMAKYLHDLQAGKRGVCDALVHDHGFTAADGVAAASLVMNGVQLNVRVGASAENHGCAPPRLTEIARLHRQGWETFVSCEPLLGPLVLAPWLGAAGFERGIDWVIVGGETGPGARPMHPAWVRSLRDQAVAAGVSFFFKSWGDWAPVCDGTDERPLGPRGARIDLAGRDVTGTPGLWDETDWIVEIGRAHV